MARKAAVTVWQEHQPGRLVKGSVSNTDEDTHRTLRPASSLIKTDREFFTAKYELPLTSNKITKSAKIGKLG